MSAVADSSPRLSAAVSGTSPRFCVPVDNVLPAAVARLEQDVIDGAELAEVRVSATAAASAWVDAVLHGFIATLAAEVRGPGTTSGQRTIALARSVADRVVAQGARRADAETIAGVVPFFRQHLISRYGAPAIAFEVDEPLAAALELAIGPGDAAARRTDVAVAMHLTIDSALHHLFDVPVGKLGLGAVARAAIAVGRAGLAGRAHRAVDSAVSSDEAVGRLAGFLARSTDRSDAASHRQAVGG